MINLKSIAQVENFDDKKFQKTFGVSKCTFATMMSRFCKGNVVNRTKKAAEKRKCRKSILLNVLFNAPKKQRKFYSGKKRRHTLKAQIVTSEGKILCTNFAQGAVHDFKLFKSSSLPFREDTLVIADTGYLGIELLQKKKV